MTTSLDDSSLDGVAALKKTFVSYSMDGVLDAMKHLLGAVSSIF